MAFHFVKGLGVPSTRIIHHQLHGKVDEYDDEYDVDTSVDVEALADDIEAMQEALLTDFEAGDVVGKLMAFVAQLRLCEEDTRDYLMELCLKNGCPTWEIRLWVRTRWESLSDCFRVVLAQQKVWLLICFFFSTPNTTRFIGH